MDCDYRLAWGIVDVEHSPVPVVVKCKLTCLAPQYCHLPQHQVAIGLIECIICVDEGISKACVLFILGSYCALICTLINYGIIQVHYGQYLEAVLWYWYGGVLLWCYYREPKGLSYERYGSAE